MPCTVENRSKKTIRLEADALIARLRVSENIYDEGKPLVNLEGPKCAPGGAKMRRRIKSCNIVGVSKDTSEKRRKSSVNPTNKPTHQMSRNIEDVSEATGRPVKSTLKNSLKHMMKIIIILFLSIKEGIGQGRDQDMVALVGDSNKRQNQTLTSDGVSPQHVPTPAFHKQSSVSRSRLIGHSTQCKLKVE